MTPQDPELAAHEDDLLQLIDALKQLERDFRLDTRFNLFDAIGMVRQEIRHSRFLAFLLDPRNPHGLGDAFLRALLLAAAAEHPALPVSRLALATAGLADAAVHCEQDHFDVTVQLPQLGLLFVIENKVDASESLDQLKRYRTLAQARYPGYAFMGCFLTREGYEGEDEQWGRMGYATVAQELRRLLANASPPPDVTMAVMHYVELIERRIVSSEALISACKRIYQQHRAALDLILEHGQEPLLAQAFDEFVRGGHPGLQAVAERSNTVHFVCSSWLRIEGFPEADRKRWSTSFPVKLWFEWGARKLFLRVEVGPFLHPSEDRAVLIRRLRERWDEAAPRAGGKGNGETYTRITRFTASVPEDPTVEELALAMEKAWKESARLHVEDAVSEAVRGLGPAGTTALPPA